MAPRPVAAAFVCAMPMELRPLARRLDLSRVDIGGMRLREGCLAGRPVVAVATGMGTRLATEGTGRLLEAVAPDHVLVVGITGAVDDETPIGTVVHPAEVVLAATGEVHRPSPPGDSPLTGVMYTTDAITTADELPALRARGVICLDMETAAVAACCEAHQVPWSVHRAISDRATDGSVDDEVFHLSRPDGSPDGAAVLGYLVRHPQRIPGLLRMAKGARLATERAADAAIAAARSLPH